eukprot:scaffold27386_cov112-Isochrysis_galbana.AAC.4
MIGLSGAGPLWLLLVCACRGPRGPRCLIRSDPSPISTHPYLLPPSPGCRRGWDPLVSVP